MYLPNRTNVLKYTLLCRRSPLTNLLGTLMTENLLFWRCICSSLDGGNDFRAVLRDLKQRLWIFNVFKKYVMLYLPRKLSSTHTSSSSSWRRSTGCFVRNMACSGWSVCVIAVWSIVSSSFFSGRITGTWVTYASTGHHLSNTWNSSAAAVNNSQGIDIATQITKHSTNSLQLRHLSTTLQHYLIDTTKFRITSNMALSIRSMLSTWRRNSPAWRCMCVIVRCSEVIRGWRSSGARDLG